MIVFYYETYPFYAKPVKLINNIYIRADNICILLIP